MKKYYIFYVILFMVFMHTSTVFALDQRDFEHIIIKGDTLDSFSMDKLSHLYLYRYDDGLKSWDMVPFQFDEVNSDAKIEMIYFEPEPDSTRGKLDEDDELVFMLKDLGDKADSSMWVEGMDSTRYELELLDPLSGETGYMYLYYSEDTTLTVPDNYEMSYDAASDRIETMNYAIEFGRSEEDNTGQMNNVFIKSGTGEDIFDRIKIRAIGFFILWRVYINENTIQSGDAYAKVGPVRIIRNMEGQFKLDLLDLKEPFIQTLLFYPYNGAFKIADIPIGEAKKVGADVYTIRISWDMNENAEGMTFYSEYNPEGIFIDAQIDEFNDSVNPGELNWTMATGDQGSLVNVFNVPDLGDVKKLYYFDYPEGDTSGHREQDFDVDTGDLMSYGDNGFILEDDLVDDIADDSILDVLYYNYFLDPNLSYDKAAQLADNLKNPVVVYTRTQEYVEPVTRIASLEERVPDDFQLFQNYPNPFNPTTTISFNISNDSPVSLGIYSTTGSLVVELEDGYLSNGYHSYMWDGKDMYGNNVPSGVYFCKLLAGSYRSTIKITLLK